MDIYYTDDFEEPLKTAIIPVFGIIRPVKRQSSPCVIQYDRGHEYALDRRTMVFGSLMQTEMSVEVTDECAG